MRAADVVVGYKTYLNLIADLIQGKEVFSSGMMKEVDRCLAAIELALAGRRVALVSSGDAGIYGMAGLVFDLCRKRNLRVVDGATEGTTDGDLEVEVIPGVAAFNAAASVLGAPLMHDFAAVSLSDHLTPWRLIERRLSAAAQADFILALYNPRSKARPHLLEQALAIVRQYRSDSTPVGILQKAMREGQVRRLATLGRVPVEAIDMQSVLIIGNSQTYVWEGWMVTPRGYLDKYPVQ